MPVNTKVRRVRNEFRKRYSSQTSQIISQLAKGRDSLQVAAKVGVSPATVATTKGNLTRGVYAPYAFVRNGEVQGTYFG